MQARLYIVDQIEGFHDCQRMHSSIGYRSPAEAEMQLMAALLGVRLIEAGSLCLCITPMHQCPQILPPSAMMV